MNEERKEMEEGMDWGRARKYIKSVSWVKAKADRNPHAYTVKKWREDSKWQTEFEWFVEAIREYGIVEYFWKKPYAVLYLDECRYWSMGWPLKETILINRAAGVSPSHAKPSKNNIEWHNGDWPGEEKWPAQGELFL